MGSRDTTATRAAASSLLVRRRFEERLPREKVPSDRETRSDATGYIEIQFVNANLAARASAAKAPEID